MKNIKKLRKEKGAITIYVILSVVFFAIFVIGAYIIANRKLQTQYEAIKKASEVYNKTSNNSESHDDGYIPIYNQDHVNAIGDGANIYIYQKNKKYSFASNANYSLEDNVIISTNYEGSNIQSKIDKIIRTNNHIIKFNDGYLYYDNGWQFTGKFTAFDVGANNYGDYVNYGIDLNRDGNTSNDWRIFLNDGENVYLIAADYVDYNWVPNSANYSITRNNHDYKLSFNDVYQDYVGSSDIINNQKLAPTLQKYHKWAYNHQDSTNTNIRAVAYMLDTDRWTAKLSNNTTNQFVDYAIGGPTIEMFADSYNAIYDNKIEYNYGNENTSGYMLKRQSEDEYHYYIMNVNYESNMPYKYASSDVAISYWFASTSNDEMIICLNKNTLGRNYYNFGSVYFRPVICLKKNVKATKSGNVWNLTGVIQ